MGKVLLLQPWGKLSDVGGRVLADALEHIDLIGIGVESWSRHVVMRLWTMPSCLAPSSDQQNSGSPRVHARYVEVEHLRPGLDPIAKAILKLGQRNREARNSARPTNVVAFSPRQRLIKITG